MGHFSMLPTSRHRGGTRKKKKMKKMNAPPQKNESRVMEIVMLSILKLYIDDGMKQKVESPHALASKIVVVSLLKLMLRVKERLKM